jgi:D-glycero-alpha-D-manno-heptose-7-phosphate kinase
MIITRTPFRITLGGGGTDLPSYYKKYGGFLISAAINKYMYVTVNKRFGESIRVSYSKTEIVNKISEIDHPIVKEALNLLDIKSGIEITSIADLPSGSGLGSSGSFAVGLLNALHAYKREYLSPKALAEEAFYIEAEILGEPVGKQDHYIAAYGGIIGMCIDNNGEVTVDTQVLSEDTVDQFENNTLFFYTGFQRKASEILSRQNESVKAAESAIVNSMHQIKEIGKQCIIELKKGDVDWFGKSLDLHWHIKKQISPKMTDNEIDKWYRLAIQNGALGGKIIGAGGGGFFIFYCNNISDKSRLRKVMAKQGLKEVRLKMDHEGSKILLNI